LKVLQQLVSKVLNLTQRGVTKQKHNFQAKDAKLLQEFTETAYLMTMIEEVFTEIKEQ